MRLIILRGPAGVGKTTLCQTLANELGADCIHDAVLLKSERIQYVQGKKWISAENFLHVNKKIKQLISTSFALGKNVVIDGNYYHKVVLDDLTSTFPNSVVFTLLASIETCIARDKLRAHSMGEQRIKDVFALTNAFFAGIAVTTDDKTKSQIIMELLEHLKKKKITS